MKVAVCVFLIINIDFVNSLGPVFSNINVPIQVREDVTSETLVSSFDVIDPDGGAVTSCSHTGDSAKFDTRQNAAYSTVFELYVVAGASIEYDNTPEFTLVVTCTDGQSETSSENITIDVIPNQPPTIETATSPLSVSENAVTQTLLYSLNVTDVENDVIFCDVQRSTPSSNNFGILFDSINIEYRLYLLSNADLNYVTVSMYTVSVECWDNYGTSGEDFVVFVLPNAAPTFTNLPADQTVDATLSMGAAVFTASAVDGDSSTVTYNMTSYPETPNLFAIDAVSGAIKTTRNLEYAEDSTYLLTVAASDGALSNTETLKIAINNINTAPTIDNLPATVYVDEDRGGNTVLYVFDRNDPDSGDTVSLAFLVWPSGYMSKFSIFQDKQIRTQTGEGFDYEDQSHFEIQIFATDGKATSGPYNLTLYINDVFEACTFGALTYYVTMNEGDAGAVTVDPGFTVTDDDVGDSYTLSIDYAASVDSTYFSIDATSGIIALATNYDVDNTHPSDVNLTVICTDSAAKTGTATVSVSVLDVNDNAPQFGKSAYISYIDQYDGPTTTVKKINMFSGDADSGINAEIEYGWTELTASSSSYFHLSVNGQIILLTYPALSMTYGDIHSFIITGTDKGTPPLTGTTRLDIIYKETNNSANQTIPTTLAPVTSSTETDSGSFWEEPVNIVAVGLGVLVGLLLAAIASYLCMKWFRKPVQESLPRKSLKPSQRKVEPAPSKPEKSPFAFWGQDNDIGGVSYTNSAVPAPSV